MWSPHSSLPSKKEDLLDAQLTRQVCNCSVFFFLKPPLVVTFEDRAQSQMAIKHHFLWLLLGFKNSGVFWALQNFFYFCLEQNKQILKRGEEVIRVIKKTHLFCRNNPNQYIFWQATYMGLHQLLQHCLEKEKAFIKRCFSCTLGFLAIACFLHGNQVACRGFLVSVGDLLSFNRCFLLSTVCGLFIRVHREGSDLLFAEGMWAQQPCLLWLCRKFTPGAGSISELKSVVFYSCPCHLSHPRAEALEWVPDAEAMSVTTMKEHHSFISVSKPLGQHSLDLRGVADSQPPMLRGGRTCVLSPPRPAPSLVSLSHSRRVPAWWCSSHLSMPLPELG